MLNLYRGLSFEGRVPHDPIFRDIPSENRQGRYLREGVQIRIDIILQCCACGQASLSFRLLSKPPLVEVMLRILQIQIGSNFPFERLQYTTCVFSPTTIFSWVFNFRWVFHDIDFECILIDWCIQNPIPSHGLVYNWSHARKNIVDQSTHCF
jgi:hypothetical protein